MNIQIQTTSVCTGKCIICPYCESWHSKHPGKMSERVFHKIIEQLAGYSIKKICPYLENEPLTDPLIFKRINVIRQAFPNALIEVSTNALALTPKKAHSLIEALADGPHEIWISFHGIDKRSFEGIMGIPFQKCLNNIIYFLKQQGPSPLQVKIRGAGMGRVSQLNHGFTFSENEYKSFWHEIFLQNEITSYPRLDYFTYHDRAMSISRNSIRMADAPRPDLTGFSCSRLKDWMHFLYTGELILCCMDYHRETVFGDIRENSLRDIFSGKKYRALARKVTGQVASKNTFICKRCISPGG